MEKKTRFGQLYPMFVSILPLLGIVEYVKYYYGWEINDIILGILLVVLAGIVHSCYLLRKQPAFYIIFSIVLLLVAIYIVNEKDLLLQNKMQRDSLIWTVIVIVLAIVCYVITRIHYGKIALSLFFLSYLLRIGMNQWMIPKLSVVSCILFCILVLGETMITRSLRKRGKKDEKVLVSMLPVYLIVYIILLLMPISENRFEWGMFRSVVNMAGNSMEELFNSFQGSSLELYDYDIAMTGYSEDGSIGGSIFDQDETVLTISSEQKISESLYLSGNTKNVYRDNQWTDQTSTDYQSWEHTEQQLALWELIYSMYRYDGAENCTTYLNQYNLDITFDDIRTTSIFHTTWMEPLRLNGILQDTKRTCNLVFKEEQEKDTSYSLTAYRLNYGLDQVISFLEKEQQYEYSSEEIDSVTMINDINKQQYFLYQPITFILENELLKRKKWIESNYLEVAEEVPERVYELTKEITKGCDTTYEKLVAIEQYLHQYTYSKSVDKVPEGRELVDYFLFDSKEGYCTYFATAMAVMARTISIPTRYVQGFIVTPDNSSKEEIEVSSMDAHAWVEAYMEGVGWISFEPTSGYEEKKYQTAVSDQSKATPAPIVETVEKQQDDYSGSLSLLMNTTKLLISLFIILLLGIVIFIVVRVQNNKRKYQKMSNTDRLLYLASKQMMLLELLGYKRRIDESWTSFTKRIEVEDMQFEFSKENEIFLRVRYHNEEITKQDLEVFLKQNSAILQKLKAEYSKHKYVLILMKNRIGKL